MANFYSSGDRKLERTAVMRLPGEIVERSGTRDCASAHFEGRVTVECRAKSHRVKQILNYPSFLSG